MAESLAAFIGVTSPELPKYIVANNFLTRFYEENILKKLSYENLKDSIICEESSEETKKKLIESFDSYLDEYAGFNLLRKNKTENFYFPLNNKMIFGYRSNLRELLYNMVSSADGYDKEDFKDKLNSFLWGDSNVVGNTKIVNTLLLKNDIAQKKSNKARDDNFGSQKNEEYFKYLGNSLFSDLELMFDSEYFNTLDFYKKYDYFATLLTSYVVFFAAFRGNGGQAPAILCKGSTQSLLNYGEFHKACVAVHGRIRAGYTKLLQEYYESLFNTDSEAEYIRLFLNENGIIKVKIGKKIDMTFSEFVNDELFDSSKGTFRQKEQKKKKIERLKEYFDITTNENRMSKKEFAYKYADFHKKQHGSNIIKISSVLSSSGGAIGFIHPKKAGSYKYFAFSSSLAEYFVRMYLSDKRKQYFVENQKNDYQIGYLNDFILWLGICYNIYFEDSHKLREFLSKDNIVPKSSEFNKNKASLIENLISINCLIKVSDSTYIVTLPEKKGEFKSL